VTVVEAQDGLRPVPREASQLEEEGELDAVSAVRVPLFVVVRLVCMITARSSTYMTPFSRFCRERPHVLDSFHSI
jgi:hypothetical protein